MPPGDLRLPTPTTSARRVALAVLLTATVSWGLLGVGVPAADASPTPAPSSSPGRLAATGPTAVDDRAVVPSDRNGTVLPGAQNDVAGSSPIDAGRTVFPADQLGSLPTGSRVSADGKELAANTHGTFTIEVDGTIAFRAQLGRTGTVSVRYRIVDASGATDDGLATVTVNATGTRDARFTWQGLPVGVNVLANDVPGRDADGSAGTLDRTSVRFPAPAEQAAPDAVTVAPDGRTLSADRVGVWTADPLTGLVTFDPDPAFVGVVPFAVRYRARDTTRGPGGEVEHHTYVSELAMSVKQTRPLPTDDDARTPYDAAERLGGAANDPVGDPGVPVRPELSTFLPDALGYLPPGSTRSADGRRLKAAGQGWWSFEADGSVVFAPVPGFVGPAYGVSYDVYDANLTRAVARLSVVVLRGPSAEPDTARTSQGVDAVAKVLGNDRPGLPADRSTGVMDATYVRFPDAGQPAGATVSDYRRRLTVPGQGVYTADRVTGAVTFDPEATFVGKASPVAYAAQDTVRRTDGRVVHNPVTSTLTVTVTPVTPTALDDGASTTAGMPVDVRVLGNDTAGAASAPLVPSSLRLRLAPGLPVGSRLSGDAKTLVVAGRGTFVAGADGVVTFTPVPGWLGRVPTVGYRVFDTNATGATAAITVDVVRG